MKLRYVSDKLQELLMHSQIATHSIEPSKQKLRVFFIPFFLVFCLWLNLPAKAQINLEAGVFIGDAYYIGDLNPDMPFRMAQLAYGVISSFCRYYNREQYTPRDQFGTIS